eukprot:SM000001S04715  [mRNA]  locus=s1:1847818:1850153:+ [translate_table: standard]
MGSVHPQMIRNKDVRRAFESAVSLGESVIEKVSSAEAASLPRLRAGLRLSWPPRVQSTLLGMLDGLDPVYAMAAAAVCQICYQLGRHESTSGPRGTCVEHAGRESSERGPEEDWKRCIKPIKAGSCVLRPSLLKGPCLPFMAMGMYTSCSLLNEMKGCASVAGALRWRHCNAPVKLVHATVADKRRPESAEVIAREDDWDPVDNVCLAPVLPDAHARGAIGKPDDKSSLVRSTAAA